MTRNTHTTTITLLHVAKSSKCYLAHKARSANGNFSTAKTDQNTLSGCQMLGQSQSHLRAEIIRPLSRQNEQ